MQKNHKSSKHRQAKVNTKYDLNGYCISKLLCLKKWSPPLPCMCFNRFVTINLKISMNCDTVFKLSYNLQSYKVTYLVRILEQHLK